MLSRTCKTVPSQLDVLPPYLVDDVAAEQRAGHGRDASHAADSTEGKRPALERQRDMSAPARPTIDIEDIARGGQAAHQGVGKRLISCEVPFPALLVGSKQFWVAGDLSIKVSIDNS